MKKIIIFLILNFFFLQKSFSQVGINTQNPKGVLDINSFMENGHYGGLVLPRVEYTNQVFTPDGQLAVEGTLIYDTKNHCIRYKKKTSWSKCIPYNDSENKKEFFEEKYKIEEIRLKELEEKLSQKEKKLAENLLKIKSLEESIVQKDSKNRQFIENLAQKEEALKSSLLEIETFKGESTKTDLKLRKQEVLLTQHEKEKIENISKIKSLKESIAKRDSKNRQLIQELNQKQKFLKSRLLEIGRLKEAITKKDLKTKELEDLLIDKEKEKIENVSKIVSLEGQLTKKELKNQQLQSQLSGQEKILENKTLEIQSIKGELSQKKIEIQQLKTQLTQGISKNRSNREANQKTTEFISLPLELNEITNKVFSPQGKERDIPYMSLIVDLHRFGNLLRTFQSEENQSLIRSVDKIRADFIGLDSLIREMRNYMKIEGKISRKAQMQSFEVKDVFYNGYQTFLSLEENINQLKSQSISREYKKVKRNFEDLKNLSSEFYTKIKTFFENIENKKSSI